MELFGKVLVLALCIGVVLGEPLEADFVESQWQEFKVTFGRKFRTTEDSFRKEIFRKNLEKIVEHNKRFEAGETTWTMGVNQFTDMTDEEFNSYIGHQDLSEEFYEAFDNPLLNHSYPESMSWVEKGAVTPVKHQGYCGSCWAFSGTGIMEGHHFIQSGKLEVFSEQPYVDCFGGCDGNFKENAIKYSAENGTILEKYYPYTATPGPTCRTSEMPVAYKPEGFHYVPQGDENLTAAVANIGPIGVSMGFEYIGNYNDGIFDTDAPCSEAGHAVLVVGYGSENGIDYYLVKNSWGESWGDKGYFRIIRGKGLCGISKRGVYAY